MIALGIAAANPAPPPPCTWAEAGSDLSIIQAPPAAAATGRDRLALVTLCHRALPRFVPFAPGVALAVPAAQDWVRRHPETAQPWLIRLAGMAQISIHLRDGHVPETPGTTYLRRQAARARVHATRQSEARQALETVVEPLGLPAHHLHARPGGLFCDLLVDAGAAADLCAQLRTALPQAGLAGWAATVTGPWAPLSFLTEGPP